MKETIHNPGFAAPADRGRGHGRRIAAVAELIATVALALSTVVAATVVSMGMARANPAGAIIENEGGVFVVALLLGVVFIGMGGLAALILAGGRSPHD